MKTLLFALGLTIIPATLYAAPPENADPAYHDWFQGQKVPGSAISCCDQADGRGVEYRVSKDQSHYEVWLDPKTFSDPAIGPAHWAPVPNDVIIQHDLNPTGRAIAWVAPFSFEAGSHSFQAGDVVCFVLPPQA